MPLGTVGFSSASSPALASNAGSQQLRVLIAGGGVAALEGALALRELAGERVSTTILAPNRDFVCRPMTVLEPFGYSQAHSYPLEEITRDIGIELRVDSFKWLHADSRVVHTVAGDQLSYDALLIALGARMYPRFKHATTVDDKHMDELLHGLIQDIEGGYVKRLAFIATGSPGWPLPIYELALMTAARAYDMNIELAITIATPEDAPLAIFGFGVSEALQRLLVSRGILTLTSSYCEVHEAGRVSVHPGARELQVDRVVAMPELHGPSVPGLPGRSAGGFIPVDAHCKVPGLEHVYAAGDATDFAIKHGGIAAQQADVAAQAIAAQARVAPEPDPFEPVIHGMLLTGTKPLYMSAHVTGGHGSSSAVSDTPTWSPPTKIVAKYLAPYLDQRDRAAGHTPAYA